MENDGSVDSPADGLSIAQLELPLVSERVGIDEREDERRRLGPLRREWTPELLGRHFLLSAADLGETRRCRGDENRLGFALTLLLVRLLNSQGISPEQVPEAVVDFVSTQVEVEPAVLAAYGKKRSQTRDDHAKRIRRHLGVRAFVASDGEPLLEFLIGRALHRDDPAVLLDEAEEQHRRERILLPVQRTLDRLVTHARGVAEQKIHRTIASQITPEHKAAFEELLEQPGSETEGSASGPVGGSPSRRSSSFAWLKEPPRGAGEKAIKELARKLGMVQDTRVEGIDLSSLNRNRVKRLARLGFSYHSPALRRFEEEKRWAIVAATLAELRGRITDDMLDMLIARTFSRANIELAEFQAKNARTVNQNLHVMRRATAVILDEEVPDPEVRRVIFEVEPRESLEQAYGQSGQTVRPEDYNNFDFIEKQYARLRKFMPVAVRTLPFTGTLAAKPVLEGVECLRELDAGKQRKLPADVPVGFVDDDWRRTIFVETPSTNGRSKDPAINRRLWELCLAEKIQHYLRSPDLHVVGSREHRDWTSYLHTDEAWEGRRESWFADWHASTDPDEYLEAAARLDRRLREVAATLEDNPFASVVDGELKLSEDEKVEIPESAKELRKKVVALLPKVSLADLLIEVDPWVEVREHLTHAGRINGHPPGASARKGSLLDTSIFTVLVAKGCNLPLSRMADASGIPYHNLVHAADWYFGEECLREAIVALVNYHHSLPISGAFGAGTTAMSDGIRFGVSARSLHARPNPRYFGTTGRGVTVYDTTSDQYTSPYVQVIRCNLREAVAVLDGILHHETELPPH